MNLIYEFDDLANEIVSKVFFNMEIAVVCGRLFKGFVYEFKYENLKTSSF